MHRIGRTARAGAGGAALSFCDQSERPYLRAIESLMRRKVDVAEHRLSETPSALPDQPRPQRARLAAPGAAKRRRRPRGRRFGTPGTAPASSNRREAFRY